MKKYETPQLEITPIYSDIFTGASGSQNQGGGSFDLEEEEF